ncbi:MAG: nuclear transport factor 2 family protein [Gemmatimonadaceae bacterium]
MAKQKHDSGKTAKQKKTMHRNAELIRDFYTCLGNRDARGMAACYHPDVNFSDEVFTNLEGAQAKAMWHMLCERGKDLKIEFRDIKADDSKGTAHWEASYTFSPTGRQVHNKIDARFEFRDGKIFRHRDTFDFQDWAAQALGPKGRLLGWSGFLKKRVRAQAAKSLAAFMRDKSDAHKPLSRSR